MLTAALHTGKGTIARWHDTPRRPPPKHTNTRHIQAREHTAISELARGRRITCLLVHGVRLTLVLGHVDVNKLHDIRADGCLEHGWQNCRADRFAGGRLDGDLCT